MLEWTGHDNETNKGQTGFYVFSLQIPNLHAEVRSPFIGDMLEKTFYGFKRSETILKEIL